MTVAGLSLESAAAIFLVVWWLVFLMALPFGVRPNEGDVPGADPGAPAQPHLLAKVLATTVVSVFVTWGVAWFLTSGYVEFHPPRPPG
jgi:predicted secreted protein